MVNTNKKTPAFNKIAKTKNTQRYMDTFSSFRTAQENFNSVEDVKTCITSTLLESIDLQFFRVKVKSSNKALFNQKKLWETTKIKEKKIRPLK